MGDYWHPAVSQEIQPVIVRDLNREHPVTQGIDTFFINLDEQFDAIIKNPDTTTVLFRLNEYHL